MISHCLDFIHPVTRKRVQFSISHCFSVIMYLYQLSAWHAANFMYLALFLASKRIPPSGSARKAPSDDLHLTLNLLTNFSNTNYDKYFELTLFFVENDHCVHPCYGTLFLDQCFVLLQDDLGEDLGSLCKQRDL